MYSLQVVNNFLVSKRNKHFQFQYIYRRSLKEKTEPICPSCYLLNILLSYPILQNFNM